MPNTENRHYPTPDLDGAANAPLALLSLAEAIDLDVQQLTEGMTDTDEELAQASPQIVNGALVRRSDTAGTFLVAEPTAGGHPATKDYADGRANAARSAAVADVFARIFRGRATSAAVPSGTPTTVTITFPSNLFDATPYVVATAQRVGNNDYQFPCHVAGYDTVSATVVVRHNNPGATMGIAVNLIAIQ